MSRKLRVMLVAAATLVGSQFSAKGDDNKKDRSTFQAKNMFLLDNPATLVPGAATLTRTDDGISFRVYTTMVPPGANTLWIVIFNKPKNCAMGRGRCMGSDLGNPAVEGSLVYGTGYIVGVDGRANFHGSLAEGTPPAGIQVNVPAGTANGLKDSMKAEIHLVVRNHGPVIAGRAKEQLTTFESTCAAPTCTDPQAVVFEAVE